MFGRFSKLLEIIFQMFEYENPPSKEQREREHRKNDFNNFCPILANSCPMHSEALMNGLDALRKAGKLFDVSLIVEGKSFKAHRAVLAACSDYFCAMFTTEQMREARQFEITLDGVSAQGIEMLLNFAYTSRLELDQNNVQDVLSASTHVQMKSVVDACSKYLESQIDLQNCVGIASLADLYSLEALKKRSFLYICARLSEFAHTPELHELTWDQMEYLLACNYPVDCPEERVLEITLQYCLDTKIKPELVAHLISHIRFKEISTCALNKLTSEWCKADCKDNEREECMDLLVEKSKLNAALLFKLIRAEKLKQDQYLTDQRPATTNLSFKDQKNIRDELINSRGMELTLVKIGGFEPNGLTNEISCYLPSKGKWEILTVIPHIEQCNYGTAVLGNDLYIVGGSYDVCLKEYIHPFGFHYCPTKNKWTHMAPIQSDRCRFSLNAVGKNYLYAVGGVCELSDPDDSPDFLALDMVSNCERYSVITDQWEYIPLLVENRSQHAGVALLDKLYISGGIDRHLVLSSLWCFDTNANKWSKMAPMPTPRADHVLIAIDGLIYACGGWYEHMETHSRVLATTIDVYDPELDFWSTETTNPIPRYYTGVAAVGRKIYFVGGLLSTVTINRATSAVHCYDLETKTWTMNAEWEYPQEAWECTCTAFYVPSERDKTKFY